jgi:hypothetical protein
MLRACLCGLCCGREQAGAWRSPAGHSHRPLSWLQLPTPLQSFGQLLLPLGSGWKGSGCCWWNLLHQVP